MTKTKVKNLSRTEDLELERDYYQELYNALRIKHKRVLALLDAATNQLVIDYHYEGELGDTLFERLDD
jgi:hypothetical protein